MSFENYVEMQKNNVNRCVMEVVYSEEISRGKFARYRQTRYGQTFSKSDATYAFRTGAKRVCALNG